MIDRTHKELMDEDIEEITSAFHAWRGTDEKTYEDTAGFCNSASLDDVRKYEYILTPGRYVGLEELEDDGEPFEEKMERLTAQLSEQIKQSRRLEEELKVALEVVGYEI